MGRQKNKKEGGSSSGFTVLFTALMIILLSFFILLNSMATIDNRREREALGSIRGSFGVLPGGMSLGGRKMKGGHLSGMGTEDSLKDLVKYLKREGLMERVAVSKNEKGLMITFAEGIFFSSGSSDIVISAIPLLDKIGEMILSISNPVQIEGHTDNIPIHTERFPSNWELSASRAANILRYFIKKFEIFPGRLFAVGCGEYRPLSPNNSEESRAKNRRVNIVILNKL